MSAIQGVSTKYYQQLSTGHRINSAADDAAGSAIVQNMTAQINESNKLVEGYGTAQDKTKVVDGALDSVTSSLQRIRELSVQASNAVYGQSERSMIQSEIDQLKQGITSVAKNSEFNTMKLLDGSDTAAGDSTLKALGIDDYDVTSGSFDISKIDDALELVTSMRSENGAKSNGLDSQIAYESLSSINLSNARSSINDVDVGKAVSDLQKQKILQDYQMFAQKARLQQKQQSVVGILNA